MVELQHSIPEPQELSQFIKSHTNIGLADWGSLQFQPIKQTIKAALNRDQVGLCGYCETKLSPSDGQIDHIKPKAKNPSLCFSYSNFVQSCINPKTCGQKKKEGLLPIEPGPGCNVEWTLSTDGTIEPVVGLSKSRRHAVNQTRDMLGLNKDSNLVDERKRWLDSAISILKISPDDISDFLHSAPYRYIIVTAF